MAEHMVEVNILSNKDLIFNMKFAFQAVKASFLLNNKEIGFFNAENSKETSFSVNHNFLKEGDNNFIIRTTDLTGMVEDKTYTISYQIGTAEDIIIGSQIIINSKQYKVLEYLSNTDGSYEITLDKALEKDVNVNRMLENSIIHYNPLIDLTFEDMEPALKPMKFVKGIYKDGMVEEEYELGGLVGDKLHSSIEMSRDNTNEIPFLRKVERFLIART
ncbi:hypothetical protein [Bacillus badius]|uniref:hypothetical protein n=1 Tax=Bacillus badius TaxID=1455 RepID=UPI000597E62C|nr:hypothetical protein [Bacillus badius]KIL74374.1 hypothetical protein SD78_1443 [Bacillus badius]